MEKRIQDRFSPVALVDIERLGRNIADMAGKAKDSGVQLRPHIIISICSLYVPSATTNCTEPKMPIASRAVTASLNV